MAPKHGHSLPVSRLCCDSHVASVDLDPRIKTALAVGAG